MNDPEPAAEFHQLTKHGPQGRRDPSKFVSFQPLDPANRPAPFKRYPDLETRPLPRDFDVLDAPAAEVLSGRFHAEPASVDAEVLARLLFLSAGVTRTTDFGRTYFRAAMSAGNLHPVEIYVVSGDVSGVGSGVHHFAPLEFGLTPLREGDQRAALASMVADPAIASAPVSLVLTGIPWRTAWKYGERGFRHLYWDAGTLLANLLAIADAVGLDARLRFGFVDADVARLVGVDGIDEFPLGVVVLGGRDEVADAGSSADDVDPLELAVTPLSARPIHFPLISDTQAAGELGDPDAVTAWRTGAPPAVPAEVEPGEGTGARLEDVILRRGSTRVFRLEAVPNAVLAWGMAVAARPVPGDAPDLLVHLLSVHAVEGTVPGVYRWEGDHLASGREGDPRDDARQVCLGQPLGGDSAFTAFHATDLDATLGRLGSRGYRVALLQAGVASGRLALAAFTLGGGATGLTYFDDLVSQLFGNPAACLLVTAVGVPGYRSTPGGRPGATAELAGFQRLMERVALGLQRRRR